MAYLRPRPSRVPRRRAQLGFLVAVFLLTLAGCGDDTSPTSGDATGDDPSAPSESATTESTEGTEPTEAPASETTEAVPSSEPAAEGLEGRLLTADELAGANDQTVWTVEATGPEDGATTGTCQRFDLVSVGANEAVRRTFTSNQDTVEAEQVVAEFADAKSAWRAHQVLKKWRATCADQVDADQVDVGDGADAEGQRGLRRLVRRAVRRRGRRGAALGRRRDQPPRARSSPLVRDRPGRAGLQLPRG